MLLDTCPPSTHPVAPSVLAWSIVAHPTLASNAVFVFSLAAISRSSLTVSCISSYLPPCAALSLALAPADVVGGLMDALSASISASRPSRIRRRSRRVESLDKACMDVFAVRPICWNRMGWDQLARHDTSCMVDSAHANHVTSVLRVSGVIV
jgi:hypothetical protein